MIWRREKYLDFAGILAQDCLPLGLITMPSTMFGSEQAPIIGYFDDFWALP
jgi:hypothetical protein